LTADKIEILISEGGAQRITGEEHEASVHIIHPTREPQDYYDAPVIVRQVEQHLLMAEITGAKIGASYEKFVGGIALGRARTQEDVAAFVSCLARPDSDYMMGQAPLIDRGLVYR
jgi:hypothetical protein